MGDVFQVLNHGDGQRQFVCKRLNETRAVGATPQEKRANLERYRRQFDTERTLARYLSAKSESEGCITPHVLWVPRHIPCSKRSLVMEQALGSLFQIFQPKTFEATFDRPLTDQDWFGVILSVTHALANLQLHCRLQHNDLHTNNLFVVPLEEENGLRVLTYTCGNKYRLSVTHVQYIVKLGDFSLSSCTLPDGRHLANERVQNGDYRDFGITAEFQPGYDLQVFLLNLLAYREHFQLSPLVGGWIERMLGHFMKVKWEVILARGHAMQQRANKVKRDREARVLANPLCANEPEEEVQVCYLPRVDEVTQLSPPVIVSRSEMLPPLEHLRTRGLRRF